MLLRNLLRLPASVLAFLTPHVLAQLPYNPTRILTAQNDTIAYLLAPQPGDTSQFTLSLLNISGSVTAAKPSLTTIDSSLPFLSGSSDAFIPLIDEDGSMSVLSGNCNQGAHGAQLWRYGVTNGRANGSWAQLSLSSDDSTLGVDFLSAGLSFSPTASVADAEMYTFGGMCPSPSTTTSASDWVSNATYSNNMLTTTPEPSSSSNTMYTLSKSPSRGPPIPEAGLTITPLLPSTSNSSSGVSQQQNFVLLGGHTQTAFINMSQVAVFSLPESSWSFMTVNSLASTSKTDLTGASAQANLEPRSGHTAVLTPDGTRIVVFGGWVGDINTAAQPQLAILELGQGYGGTADWSWAVPSLPNPFNSGQGIYGHGAAMLTGGVMMVMGGYRISSSSSSKHKRAQTTNSQALLFNTTSSSWISTYTNPNSPLSPAYTAPASAASDGSVHSTSEKAGLGVGVALGSAAVLGVFLISFFYRRRLRQRRAMREKELRELALGAERFHSGSLLGGGGIDGRGGTPYPDVRSASWGSRQERRLGTSSSMGDEDYPWAPVMDEKDAEKLRIEHEHGDDGRRAERTGLLIEIPSPTRGLRKSLYGRVQPTYGAATGMNGRAPSVRGVPGSIHRIDEAEEEGSLPGSLRRKKSASLGALDKSGKEEPFMDTSLQPRPLSPGSIAKRKREREVAGWKDDWSAAAAAIDHGHLSRNTSKAESNWRTHSNLSEDSHSPTHSGMMHSSSGRGSPDKSDRTGSNLSERSAMSGVSIQRSVIGTVSRTASIRSASAGYALFAGAAAAMASRVTGSSTTAGPSRTPSKRAASLNMNSNSSSVRTGKIRDRSDTFITARTSFGPAQAGEREALLGPLNTKLDHDNYATPPESPVKERAMPVMRQRDGSIRQAVGHIIGSARRVLTGTGAVAVSNRVAEFENRSEQNSPTKDEPEMTETPGRNAVSTSILRGARGREDWGLEPSPKPASEVRIVKRKPFPGQSAQPIQPVAHDSDDDEWDVEAAVERRVVQVMFTVPKEKLRVVNADALSILSKSSVDFEGGENDGGGGEDKENRPDPKRVSTVVEEPSELEAEHGEVEGKGKARAL